MLGRLSRIFKNGVGRMFRETGLGNYYSLTSIKHWMPTVVCTPVTWPTWNNFPVIVR